MPILKMSSLCVISLTLLLSTLFTDVVLSEPQGWQSSWNAGEDYASSIHYNSTSNAYHIIGTSYNSSNGVSRCILSEIDLQKNQNKYLKEFLGAGSELTSCSSMSVHGADRLIVTGFMEQSRKIMSRDKMFALIDSSNENDGTNVINGFVLNINGDTGIGINGKILAENKVTYPLLSVTDEINGGIIVASLITSDVSLNANYEYEEELPTGRLSSPNPNILKYGSASTMSVALQYFGFVKTTSSFRNGWTRVLSTTDEKDVRIHDMALYRDRAFLVGATTGHGIPFGAKDWSGSSDLDGFITAVQISDGKPLLPSKRIATEGNLEDIVNAICIDYINNVIYIAGSTTGFMDAALKRSATHNRFSAFLMKLDADSLGTIWAKQVFTQPSQVYAPQDVLGMGCSVAEDGNGIYLTGIVHNEGNVVKEGVGYGMDDIFVAKYNANGEQVWKKQVGTDNNDVVAKGHKSIAFDEDKNIVVIGTTRGNMYRQKSMNSKDQTSDIFIITLDKDDGSYPALFKPNPIQSTTGVMVASTSNAASTSATESTESSKWNAAQIFVTVCLFGFLIFSLFLAAYTIGAQRTKKTYLRHQEDDHAEVQRYLEQLEEQEQAQTKSATVTSTLKHMFTRSSGVDTLNRDTNGVHSSAFDDFPQEIRFDPENEPATNKSSQFTVSDLGVTDDFMGGGSIASENDIGENHDEEQDTDPKQPTNSASAYDELLQGLHSISGLDDVVDTDLTKVDLNENNDKTNNENGQLHSNPFVEELDDINESSAEII